MPIKPVHGTSLKYYLMAFNAAGNERDDDPEGKMSQKILDVLSTEPITDVFIFSHGWLGDVRAAYSQYDKWTAAMAAQEANLQRMQQVRPGFPPLLIGGYRQRHNRPTGGQAPPLASRISQSLMPWDLREASAFLTSSECYFHPFRFARVIALWCLSH